MKIRSLVHVTAAVLALGVVRAAVPVVVSQKGLQFSTDQLSVDKGSVVSFKNDDRTAHNITVTGEDLKINGGLQQPGEDFKVPFSKPGTYEVRCAIHPKMKMTITVK